MAVTASGTLGMHLIIPALPAAATELQVSPATIQLTITLYLLGLAIGQLLYGPLSDRLGRRPVLLGGLSLFTLAGVATSLAPSATWLIVARVLQSIGGCSGLVLGRAIVRDTATADRAVARLALLTLVMSMAPAIAPVIGGYATAWIGWRAAFGVLAAIGFITALLTWFGLPETTSSSRGSMLSGMARLVRSRAFCGFAIGGACTTTSFYAFMSASPFIFEDQLHQPTERIGLYYLLLMLGLAAGGFTANWLAGRMRMDLVLRLANLIAIAAAAWFLAAWFTGTFNLVSVVGSVGLFMVGAGIASPFALTSAVSVNPQTIGAASGLYGFVQMIYGAICTVLVETIAPGSVITVGAVMLGSALLGQAAVSVALRTRPA